MNWSLRWRSPSKRESMILPDYSEYLKQPGMLAWIEQEWKANPHIHDEHARVVNESIDKFYIRSIFEWGCGTGNLASRLKAEDYTGIDINEDCIEYAQNKVADRYFQAGNIRTANARSSYDLVISFGFLKHFGLHEWFDIFKKVSSFGEYFIFDMPIGKETKDDGTEYHHVWKSYEEIEEDIKNAGLEMLDKINWHTPEPIFICKKK